MKPEECNSMVDIREQIDLLDSKIVELIAQRDRFVKCAAKFKKNEKAVRDSKRVEEVIKSKKLLAQKFNVSSELIGNIYSVMIDFFVNDEVKTWKSINNKD